MTGRPSWSGAGSLTTARLTLDPLRVDDAPQMVEVLSAPSLYAHIGGHPPTLAELTSRYRSQVAGPTSPDEAWRNWIIRHEGRACGFVQATIRRDGTRVVAEVAWLVRPAEQGRGIASEAAAAMVARLRSAEGVSVVQARIADANAGSVEVARRLGLVPTDRVADGERLWTDASGNAGP